MKMNRSARIMMLVMCLSVGMSCGGCEEVDGEELQIDPDALCEPRPAEEVEDCDIPLGSQDLRLFEIEDFEVLCAATCNRVRGAIVVGPKISSLRPLKNIKYVGYLSLNEARLSLKGELESLEAMGTFSMTSNDNIRRIEGLDKVSSIGWISVEANTVLEHFDAFSSLEEMDEAFNLIDNPNLKYAKVLPSLKEHRNAIIIADNRRLERLEGLNEQASTTYFEIFSNRSLTDISGLKSPQAIGMTLKIELNERLPKCQVDAFIDGIEQRPEYNFVSGLDDSATCSP